MEEGIIMNHLAILAVFCILLNIFIADAVNEIEIRGPIVNTSKIFYNFNQQQFGGFFYDLDENIGTEQITIRLSNANPDGSGATISDQTDENGNRGIEYYTEAKSKNFSFKRWGKYNVIGFLGDPYFVSYIAEPTRMMIDENEGVVPYLYDKSEHRDLMIKDQLSEVLIDKNIEMTITSNNPLRLQEGYQLAIKSVDINGNKAYVELSKYGQVVDSKVVQPSIDHATMNDKTYYYKTDIGDAKEIIQIAVHFKNAFLGSDTNIATIDGIFQLSDTPKDIGVGTSYDKMSIRSTNADTRTIIIDNKDNPITLSKNHDKVLMQNIYIKTANQNNISENNPLRFYIYKIIKKPGDYEIRGSIANLSVNMFSWNYTNFAGFYYDLDNDVGTERLTLILSEVTPTGAILSDTADVYANLGITYFTQAQNKEFKFKLWGQYYVIGFLGGRYFVAYDKTTTAAMSNLNILVPYLKDKSKNWDLMAKDQLSEVLIDKDTEMTITSNSPLRLQEGYQLAIKSVDINGNKAYIELSKYGQVVDSKVVQPSIDNATMNEKTYYYKADIGDTEEIIQIAVHFKNAFRGSDTNIATIDGIFQLSDAPKDIGVSTSYDKMSIRSTNADTRTIIMDNKDNPITLSKNRDRVLMQNIYIRTADQDDISENNPLRFYICKKYVIEGAEEVQRTTTNPLNTPSSTVDLSLFFVLLLPLQ